MPTTLFPCRLRGMSVTEEVILLKVQVQDVTRVYNAVARVNLLETSRPHPGSRHGPAVMKYSP